MTMNISKTQLCVLLWMASVYTGYAQRRSYADAEQIARKEMSSFKGILEVVSFDKEGGRIYKTRGKDSLSNNAFYVYNNLENPSFVIVSGDERMKTILGSCDNTVFDPNNMPCGLSVLLSHYAEQYAALDEYEVEGSRTSSRPSKAPSSDIKPILSSTWHQAPSPYNDNVPTGCPTGCIATGMGQIMYFYRYPATGEGQFSYTSRTDKYKLSYDFGKGNFDWDSMQDSYSDNSSSSNYGSTRSRKAVANILEACGVSVAMNYTTSGSGSNETTVPYALINYFKYNKNVVVYERDCYRNEEWYNIVYEELTSGRPILYMGVDRTGDQPAGHAFIIDGYRKSDGMFHVNWGWGGDYDSYYELDALNPPSPPNGFRFSSGQCMIARFTPDELGPQEDIFYAEEFTHEGSITLDKSLNFVLTGIRNYSNSSSNVVNDSYFSGVIGIGLFDENFNLILSLKEETLKARTFSGFSKLSLQVNIPSNMIKSDEEYYIAPYAKSVKSTIPTRIRTIGGRSDYYTISLDGGGDKPGNGDDPVEKEVLIEEDFESSQLPSNWDQEQVQGRGVWKGQLVLFGNESSNTPNPSSGNGYAYLNYNSGTIFGNIRTVTKLVTPELSGMDGQQYMLSFQNRKYSSQAGTTEIITVLIDRGCNGQWEILSEQSIVNQNTWMPIQVQYTASGSYKLAIEGSLEYGSTLFVDDVKVSLIESQSGERNTLVLEMKDGQDYRFSLKEKPVLTMPGGKVKIETSEVTASYDLQNVVRFYFTSDGSGDTAIREITNEQVGFTQTTDNRLIISNLSEKDRVIVCGLNGQLYNHCISHRGRDAEVNLNSCPKGLYIIKIGKNQSIKIAKK